MKKIKILWVDDEMDLLKPHIMFLQEKGYEMETATNGHDAIEMVKQQYVDLVFLDENMPGLSGIETLGRIKALKANLPVIMITKSEEENIMEAALGAKIADYLIKPVNPNQILLSIKKNLETKKLITRETTSAYQSEFSSIGMKINNASSYAEWEDIYKQLVFWELELERSEDQGMTEVFGMQKAEADLGFSRFIRNNYSSWFKEKNTEKPLLSPGVFKEKVFPLVEQNQKVFVILIDNLRLDQWRVITPVINEYFIAREDTLFCSILPTATQYARNAMFAGLMPGEIQSLNPHLWLNDDEEGAKNMNEEELLQKHLKRLGKKYRLHYDKIIHSRSGKKLVDNFSNLLNYDLVVVVYNFIDMLSHANTEMNMIRELAVNDSAYRSLVLSWFQHSQLLDFIRLLAEKDVTVIITTDHGSIRVNNPVKVIGDRKTSSNLRYKTGKNLNYNQKEVFEIGDPFTVHLPKSDVSSRYIFSMAHDYMVYPNNYNYYVNYYKNTYQHGGISMEEMLIPFAVM
ncbi:MAG: bifunctional response regulator/alkaline phosphatase family protein, partial [Bacteroidales bacterium]|nr:bifunctional response regulator/alkaline phosphatase family protein [Bacteroidales bacterium]